MPRRHIFENAYVQLGKGVLSTSHLINGKVACLLIQLMVLFLVRPKLFKVSIGSMSIELLLSFVL